MKDWEKLYRQEQRDHRATTRQLAADSAELEGHRWYRDTVRKRIDEAQRRWRKASPKTRALVRNDLGELLFWLMQRSDAALRQKRKALKLRDDALLAAAGLVLRMKEMRGGRATR